MDLTLAHNLGMLDALAGARIVALQIQPAARLTQIPEQLAGMAQLRDLWLNGNPLEGGWQHMPQQLQHLDLCHCRLQQFPAALAGMTQLRELKLTSNPVQGGWQHLPQQLQHLHLDNCSLQQVLAQLAGHTLKRLVV